MFDSLGCAFDYPLGLLVLACLGIFVALLLPVPGDRRPGAPTDDTTKTRRLP